MQTIQKGSQERIVLNVFNDGVLTQADVTPTLTIYDADLDSSPITGYSNVTATDDPEDGIYSFFLGSSLTNTKRVLQVVWSYVVNGSTYEQTDFYSVEYVYASVSEIIDFLSYGSQPQDLNYRPVEEIAAAEKIARTIVDGYTGQKFYKRVGTQEMFGKGSDALQLVEKMGGVIAGIAFVIELMPLKGREKLKGYQITSLIKDEYC